MSDKFWLIQRASFDKDIERATELFGSKEKHLIHPEYMGAAEFEWGSIPRAYVRIMSQFERYKLFCDDLKTIRGVPVCLFCREDRHDETIEAIKAYIREPYTLKEWSNLTQHFKETSEHDKYSLRTNFWWCIDHSRDPESTGYKIGDWMLFIGAKDRQNAFTSIINLDYLQWFQQLQEEEREEKIKEAWRNW